jgi:DNA-binding transcriptional regulator YiaG
LVSNLNDFAIKVLCEDPNYDIRPDGTIFTLIQATGKRSAKGIWRTKPFTLNDHGYARIRYDYRDLYVHRVIAQKFIGEISGLQVNHIDGNRKNNHRDNLELVTASQNMLHSFKVLQKKTGKNFRKLDQTQVDFIRELLAKDVSAKELAVQFGVSVTTIFDIKQGRRWKAAANG